MSDFSYASMASVKYCKIHKVSYTSWCARCLKDSHDEKWNRAAAEIQATLAMKEFAWTALEDIPHYIFKGEAVRAFLQDQEGFELALRELRVREHLANWVKHMLSNPDFGRK